MAEKNKKLELRQEVLKILVDPRTDQGPVEDSEEDWKEASSSSSSSNQ